MNVLFVHGMGRTSLSWLPTLARFKAKGLRCHTFGYNVTVQDFSSIVRRLVKTLSRLSTQGEYVVVGHSLGGVLLRAALAELATATPRPRMLFLLGSPVIPSRLAMRLGSVALFRFVTRDSGRMLGSLQHMQAITSPGVPSVAIVGTRGLRGRLSPFGVEDNDGVVAVSETTAGWLDEIIRIPVVHTLLPSSRQAAQIMLDRIKALSASG